jgi:hypothetical protein
MRFKRKEEWKNWFAWYPVWLNETNESVWLEWTHRYPEYFKGSFLGYYYRPGKIKGE